MRLIGCGGELDDLGLVRNVSLISMVLRSAEPGIVLTNLLLHLLLNRIKLIGAWLLLELRIRLVGLGLYAHAW